MVWGVDKATGAEEDQRAAVDVDRAERVVLRLLDREVSVSALSVVTRRRT
ncbi:MAG: hypothetical protein ABIK79_14140 [Chloroflexota bacterium]|nr:hypothetical protein [Anaerolineae bacterium]